jgi:hypothetical protein
MFFIIGCSKKTDAVTLSGMYTITADVTMDNFKGTISLNRLGSGSWEINFSKPDNINGLNVSYQNGNANINFKGLSLSMNRDDIPMKAIVSNITSVLDKLSTGKDVKYTKSNGKITAKGAIDNSNFEVVMNEKNKSLISLNMKDIGLEATFSDYKPMK